MLKVSIRMLHQRLQAGFASKPRESVTISDARRGSVAGCVALWSDAERLTCAKRASGFSQNRSAESQNQEKRSGTKMVS